MKKTTTLLLLITTALLQPFALQAKPGKGDFNKEQRREQARERMQSIDSNGDGTISYAEAESADAKRLIENFDTIDADGDGILTKKELGAQHNKKHEQARERMQSIDSNGDGTISYAEAASADAKRLIENFDTIDADGDGALTPEELREHHQKMRGTGMKMKKKKQES